MPKLTVQIPMFQLDSTPHSFPRLWSDGRGRVILTVPLLIRKDTNMRLVNVKKNSKG